MRVVSSNLSMAYITELPDGRRILWHPIEYRNIALLKAKERRAIQKCERDLRAKRRARLKEEN